MRGRTLLGLLLLGVMVSESTGMSLSPVGLLQRLFGRFLPRRQRSARQYILELEERLVELEIARDALLETTRQLRDSQRVSAVTRRTDAETVGQLKREQGEATRAAAQKAAAKARTEQKRRDADEFEKEKQRILSELDKKHKGQQEKALRDQEADLTKMFTAKIEGMKSKFEDTLKQALEEKDKALQAATTERAKERKALVSAFSAKEKDMQRAIHTLEGEVDKLHTTLASREAEWTQKESTSTHFTAPRAPMRMPTAPAAPRGE